MDEKQEYDPVQEVNSLLCQWLDQDKYQSQQLVDWLQGYGLPPLGHDDDPFQWLLRGVEIADDRYQVESSLAERAARLLEEEPEVKRPGTRPDQLLYNLFMLSAGLSCPDQLADPLYAVFERQALKGSWLGIDVREALTDALISNQLDNRLEEVWQEMCENRGHDFLPGDEEDGLDGIRLMPVSAATRGEPALYAIGKALGRMATHVEKEPDCRLKFQSLISRIVETYPGRSNWDQDLIYQADKNQWPSWAVECLPRLYVPLVNFPD